MKISLYSTLFRYSSSTYINSRVYNLILTWLNTIYAHRKPPTSIPPFYTRTPRGTRAKHAFPLHHTVRLPHTLILQINHTKVYIFEITVTLFCKSCKGDAHPLNSNTQLNKITLEKYSLSLYFIPFCW